MRRFGLAVIAVAVIGMTGFVAPAIASAADECMHGFGSHQQLVDAAGASAQEWTVTDLKKSADPTPGYPLVGQLWEATASVQAISGTVTPIIPNFQARTASGNIAMWMTTMSSVSVWLVKSTATEYTPAVSFPRNQAIRNRSEL